MCGAVEDCTIGMEVAVLYVFNNAINTMAAVELYDSQLHISVVF